MDRRKNSRSQPRPEANVKMISAKATPVFSPMQKQNASFYEIDIQSSLDYHDQESIPAGNRMWEKVGNKKGTAAKGKAFENPFIESYYPKIHKPQSEIKKTPRTTKKIDSDVQTELEPEKTEKSNKENQSPSFDSDAGFRQNLKSYIIENFMSKNDSKVKAVLQTLSGKSENDQVHIHHHEHHHYYYFEDTKLLEKEDATEIKSAMRRHSKEPKSPMKLQEFETEEPKHTYYFNWSGVSNVTFTKPSVLSTRSQTTDSDESQKSGFASRAKEIASRSKCSNSLESIINKKSDFITTHIYSDSELTKRNSEETEAIETNSQMSLNISRSYFVSTVPVVETQDVPSLCSGRNGTDEEMTSWNEEEDQMSTGKIRKTLPFTSLKTNNSPIGDNYYHNWAAKFKAELREIKRELSRIERKHLERKKSFIMQLNQDRRKDRSENKSKVFVYSSKTFILAPGDVYLKGIDEKGAKSPVLKLKEEECAVDNTDEIFLKEQSICKEQQIYLIPNNKLST